MKKLLILVILGGFAASCAMSHKMDPVEKEKLRGFHANQAKKIIDKNEANKEANKKASEKQKIALNNHLNTLNKNKGKGTAGNNGAFKFY